MAKHVMIDIETLSTATDAFVVSIGACVFDSSGAIRERLHVAPDADEQTRMRRTIDASTVKWWMGQAEDAQAEFKLPQSPISVCRNALWGLIQTATDGETKPLIWALGPQFDLVILESLFKGSVPLWTHRQVADMRTLRHFLTIERERNDTAHSALDDAIYQAEWVSEALRRLAHASRMLQQ